MQRKGEKNAEEKENLLKHVLLLRFFWSQDHQSLYQYLCLSHKLSIPLMTDVSPVDKLIPHSLITESSSSSTSSQVKVTKNVVFLLRAQKYEEKA